MNISTLINRMIGLFIFIIFLPLMVIIGLLIKLDSPGPIIFSHVRLGKNRKRFRFYKFRTMWKDAKKRFPELYKYMYSKKELNNLLFKLPEDPRLTKFGRYLRITSLDELPNLINVIRGEMNFVGPRPEIPEMLKYYGKNQLTKFSVRPGITGYSQVSGRGLLTFKETITFDLKYIEEKSFGTDLKILIKTIWVIIKAIGAF
jgi:lipopolysaccharide/colanic/teichoic acid biosynthesis glycosyltransferase